MKVLSLRRILSITSVIVLCSASLISQPGQVLQYLSRYIQRPISYNKGAAETVGYDAATKTAVFSDGAANKITFLNMSNPASPVKLRDVLLNAYSGRINSVAVRGGVVAVALEDITAKSDPGQVVFFDINGNFRSSVRVGALPDMLTFTPDGTKVIVCNEGEPNDTYTIDPEGSVSVISIASLTAPTVTTIGFSSLNGRQDSLRAMGIRIYGPNATVAQVGRSPWSVVRGIRFDGMSSVGQNTLRLRASEIGSAGYYTVRLRSSSHETTRPLILHR